ncbi:hypothetical protein QAD02_019224 [Eretmocerus hayati]|uniref:Uncharacterized protein n=1 Tax=Eretmocerus hayati TaxID=131215 RepID=A0ACC2PJ06_9HYME|nr:hypothetical protein QAD02_019224 [Eretmocerus hayati]
MDYTEKLSETELRKRHAQRERERRKRLKNDVSYRQKEIERKRNYRLKQKNVNKSRLQPSSSPMADSSCDSNPPQMDCTSKKQPMSVAERVKAYKKRKRLAELQNSGVTKLSIIDIINQNIADNNRNKTKVRVIESTPPRSEQSGDQRFGDEFFLSRSLQAHMLGGCSTSSDDSNANKKIIEQDLAQRFVTYVEHPQCAEPKIRKKLRKNVPSSPRGNCLFYCFIMSLNWEIGPIELRRILLASPHVNYCGDPKEARKILASDEEFGDADVIFIFSRHYKCNVCVHWHLRGKILYLQIKYNENPTFIHLRLEGNHFEPYIPTPRRHYDHLADARLIEGNEESHTPSMTNCEQSSALEINEKTENIQIHAPLVRRKNLVGIVPGNNSYRLRQDHAAVCRTFENNFPNNSVGYTCSVCHRLWSQEDLQEIWKKKASKIDESLSKNTLDPDDSEGVLLCENCRKPLERVSTPNLSKYKDSKNSTSPAHLPLDTISERPISSRLPFMKILGLRHTYGEPRIDGQINDVLVSVENTMVKSLPRHVSDGFAINVYIKKKLVHEKIVMTGCVNKVILRAWLDFMMRTPLYRFYNNNIDQSFLNSGDLNSNQGDINKICSYMGVDLTNITGMSVDQNPIQELFIQNFMEDIPIEESIKLTMLIS